jgi:2-hydroxychromene-2-carboxylate isomerase
MSILNFWFEFASTYSYPAAMRIGSAVKGTGVNVRWRPFLLGPIFKAQGWDNSPFNLFSAKGRYMWRDIERECNAYGLPFRRPEPFPQPSLLAARVATLGTAELWGDEFVRAVYRAEFADGRRIDDPEVMTDILNELRVDAADILARAQSDRIKAQLRDATAEALERGIFGAPTFITEDCEMFWGNDRLEQAVAWAKGAKTARRA